MKKINTAAIAITGITAAIYAVATLAISPIAYGSVQFRISEIMVLLPWINPIFAPGLILGCAIANMFSPLGLIDVAFGTFHTFCSVMMIKRTKNMVAASLWPTILSFLIGLELYLVYSSPFIVSTLWVMLGEFICITCIGCPVFKLITKNSSVMRKLQSY